MECEYCGDIAMFNVIILKNSEMANEPNGTEKGPVCSKCLASWFTNNPESIGVLTIQKLEAD